MYNYAGTAYFYVSPHSATKEVVLNQLQIIKNSFTKGKYLNVTGASIFCT